MVELGRFAVLVALGSGLWVAGDAIYATRTGRSDAVESEEEEEARAVALAWRGGDLCRVLEERIESRQEALRARASPVADDHPGPVGR